MALAESGDTGQPDSGEGPSAAFLGLGVPRAGHAQERNLQNKRVAHAGCAPRERRASYVTLCAHAHTCRGAQTVWSVHHTRGVRDFADRRGVARARGLRACPLPGPPHVWGSRRRSAAWPALRRPSCLLSRWQERTVTPTWARASRLSGPTACPAPRATLAVPPSRPRAPRAPLPAPLHTENSAGDGAGDSAGDSAGTSGPGRRFCR